MLYTHQYRENNSLTHLFLAKILVPMWHLSFLRDATKSSRIDFTYVYPFLNYPYHSFIAHSIPHNINHWQHGHLAPIMWYFLPTLWDKQSFNKYINQHVSSACLNNTNIICSLVFYLLCNKISRSRLAPLCFPSQ